MAEENFIGKYRILIFSIFLCAFAFLILSVGGDSFTGRFFSTEPKIIEHGKVLIYETGMDENLTKTYSLVNAGETKQDVFMSSKNGALIKIFLPELGWKDLPENISGQELCIANDMRANSTMDGYKLAAEGISSENILQLIHLASFDSNTTNPCNRTGEYILEAQNNQ
jgi:hypothetical protein